MTTLKEFANDLAAVEFPGVKRRYATLPKELYARDLPASWVDMPEAAVNPEAPAGTFSESGVVYTANLFIAAAVMSEGYPDAQRDLVLDLGTAVVEWARPDRFVVRLVTNARLPVGGKEYRGVVANISLVDLE